MKAIKELLMNEARKDLTKEYEKIRDYCFKQSPPHPTECRNCKFESACNEIDNMPFVIYGTAKDWTNEDIEKIVREALK